MRRDSLGAGLTLVGLTEIVIATPWIGRIAIVIGVALIAAGAALFVSEPP